eukprot:COSAG01_NODE_2618_length_7371_cov_13.342959_1_plen_377_part_00
MLRDHGHKASLSLSSRRSIFCHHFLRCSTVIASRPRATCPRHHPCGTLTVASYRPAPLLSTGSGANRLLAAISSRKKHPIPAAARRHQGRPPVTVVASPRFTRLGCTSRGSTGNRARAGGGGGRRGGVPARQPASQPRPQGPTHTHTLQWPRWPGSRVQPSRRVQRPVEPSPAQPTPAGSCRRKRGASAGSQRRKYCWNHGLGSMTTFSFGGGGGLEEAAVAAKSAAAAAAGKPARTACPASAPAPVAPEALMAAFLAPPAAAAAAAAPAAAAPPDCGGGFPRGPSGWRGGLVRGGSLPLSSCVAATAPPTPPRVSHGQLGEQRAAPPAAVWAWVTRETGQWLRVRYGQTFELLWWFRLCRVRSLSARRRTHMLRR